MVEVTTAEAAFALLREDNPRASDGDCRMYGQAWVEWQHANAKIVEDGTIVSHPRTSAPIENPYLKIRFAAMATMQKLGRVRATDRLWALAR